MRIDGVEISDEQVDEFKEAFAEFDMNSDGTITSQELGLKQRTKEGMVIRRVEGEIPTEEELRQMVAEVDQDENGTIELNEFLSMMAKRTQATRKIKQVFEVFDQDSDGFISCAELSTVMNNLGENLSSEELDEMMRWGDKDGDGKVGAQEFSNMMMELMRKQLSGHRY